MTTQPIKKRPRCRKCGSMMAGHKRLDGYPICPDDTSATSPSASTSSTFPSCRARHAFHGRGGGEGTDDDDDADDNDDEDEDEDDEENLEIPKYGVWHRINPNWVDPPMPRTTSPPYAGSVISTVLNSDACSVAKLEDDDGAGIQEAAGYYYQEGQGDDDDDDDERTETETEMDDTPSLRSSSRFNSSLTRSRSSFIGHMLKASVPLASLFATSRDKVPHLRKAAHKQGLHVGLMKKPSHASRKSRDDTCPSNNVGVQPEGSGGRGRGGSIRSSSSSKRARSPVCPDGSWWVVMGKDAAAVRHIEERALPLAAAAGFAGPDAKLQKRAEHFPNAAFVAGFLQLVLAGVFGGLIVVYGLSLL